jgi:hypothetical protein
MPLDAPRPEFRTLAPWPAGLHLDGPTETYPSKPPAPAARHPQPYTGSAAGLAADSPLAEPD